MDVRTYRAQTMHDALLLVRRELGPDAAVLHTREVQRSRLFGLLPGPRHIEVTASAGVNVPSRLAPNRFSRSADLEDAPAPPPPPPLAPTADRTETPVLPTEMQAQISDLQKMVEELCRSSHHGVQPDLPEGLFHLFTELLDAELSEDLARELVERVRDALPEAHINDPALMKSCLAGIVESELRVSGPIATVAGRPRVAALVGPTGVGKTTTIAKLAANFRLRERRRVGLITVDTYRIAAVEQLRTYADIIDLPMQVVSSPTGMREALGRFCDLDVVLIDTAGRSPKDEVKIRELKTFLAEAGADEIHLVLSAAAGERALIETAQRFATIGTTALLLTKLDEATGLGGVLPVVRSSGLPLSYLTNGQNVPDDIDAADPRRLARLVLGMSPEPTN